MAINWKNNILDQGVTEEYARKTRATVRVLRSQYDTVTDGRPLPRALQADLDEIDAMEKKVLGALRPTGMRPSEVLLNAVVVQGIDDPLRDTATLLNLHDSMLHRTPAHHGLKEEVEAFMMGQRRAAWEEHTDAVIQELRKSAEPYLATVKEFTDLGDRAAEALAADDDAVAVNYSGKENLGKWAAASEAIAQLNRVQTFVSALIKMRGENMYTYLGALVWADLTYEQERELFERYLNQLEFRSGRGYLGVWHVLLGGYPIAIADGPEFTARNQAYLQQRDAGLGAKRAQEAQQARYLAQYNGNY